MKFPIIRKKPWLRVGFDPASNKPVDIAQSLLDTHLHAVGPPGSGKSCFILWLFQQLARIPDATIFLFTSKGTLCHQARDCAIMHGLTERVDFLDPGDGFSYNPLAPNGASVATQAKAVREGVRSAWGQNSFDETPQLARWLFLILYAVREVKMTFLEALGMLRPESKIRGAIVRAVADPYIREALEHLDSLREQRQEELLASTLARLESFVADPNIRRILAPQRSSFNVGEAIANHRIVLGSFRNYDPVRPDDNRLLVRMLINDIVAHVFSRSDRSPVYLIIDEAQDFLTADLCRALDQGRELKFSVGIAHQYVAQLQTEQTSDLIYHSVMECARTKIVFGGVSTQELELLTSELMIDQVDVWRVKDELTSLEAEPVETTRDVITEGEATSQNLTRTQEVSQSQSRTQTQGQEASQGQSVGISRETGITETMGESEEFTSGHVTTSGRASTTGQGSGVNDTVSDGLSIDSVLPVGAAGAFIMGAKVTRTSTRASGRSRQSFDSTTDSSSQGDIETLGRGYNRARGRTKTLGQNLTNSQTRGVSQNHSQGAQKGQSRALALGLTAGKNKSKTVTPFHEYKKSRIVSSRTFLNKDEQLTLFLQKIKTLPRAHFVLKTPNHKAVFLRAPFVKDPWLSRRRLDAALQRIYAKPFYPTPEQIAAEEQDRASRIKALLPPAPEMTPAGVPPLPAAPKPPKIKKSALPNPKKSQTPWDTLDNIDTSDNPDSGDEK